MCELVVYLYDMVLIGVVRVFCGFVGFVKVYEVRGDGVMVSFGENWDYVVVEVGLVWFVM